MSAEEHQKSEEISLWIDAFPHLEHQEEYSELDLTGLNSSFLYGLASEICADFGVESLDPLSNNDENNFLDDIDERESQKPTTTSTVTRSELSDSTQRVTEIRINFYQPLDNRFLFLGRLKRNQRCKLQTWKLLPTITFVL